MARRQELASKKHSGSVIRKCVAAGLSAVLASSFPAASMIAYADVDAGEDVSFADSHEDDMTGSGEESFQGIETVSRSQDGEDGNRVQDNEDAERKTIIAAVTYASPDAGFALLDPEADTAGQATDMREANESESVRTAISQSVDGALLGAQQIEDAGESVSIEVTQNASEISSDGNSPLVTVSGAGLTDEEYIVRLYYKASTSSSYSSKGKTLSGDTAVFSGYPALSNGKSYELYATLEKDSVEVARSSTVAISAVKPTINGSDVTSSPSITGSNTGSISVAGAYSEIAYFPYGGSISDAVKVPGSTISGLAAGDYYVFVPAYSNGNTFYLKSSSRKVTVGETEGKNHSVTLATADGVKWSGNSGNGSFYINEAGSKSVYARPSDEEKYFVSGITVSPAENATVSFSESTGEVLVQNVTGDVTLIPQVTEKAVPSSLSVTKVEFKENGEYSETNASVQVTYSVEVKDQFENLVPGVSVYFKTNESDVSATQTRKSSAQGVATFKSSYTLPQFENKADFNALFSLSRDFADGDVIAAQDIHLVLNRNADLVLYADQIIGTAPGTNDGRVINVPDDYEIWTGEVHQGALVVGSGSWVSPVNGEFTGLSAGQHLLRFGERVDAKTNTFYFASNGADFFVPRGVWTVSADTQASKNVHFLRDLMQKAEQGGTVYFPVIADGNKKISSYFVDKPSYVSDIHYDEDGQQVVLEGVTGNVKLTVIAEGDLTGPAYQQSAIGASSPTSPADSATAGPSEAQNADSAANVNFPDASPADGQANSAVVQDSQMGSASIQQEDVNAAYASEGGTFSALENAEVQQKEVSQRVGDIAAPKPTNLKIDENETPTATTRANGSQDAGKDGSAFPFWPLIPFVLVAIFGAANFVLRRPSRLRIKL